MAKRFTDTNKWKKRSFRKADPVVKLFWLYLLDNCDHAGIWDVDLELAEFCIGEELDEGQLRESLRDSIVVFDDGKKWHIPAFIEFQYADSLNPNNKVHGSVIKELKKMGLPCPLEGATKPLTDEAKDKEKEKDKDKDKDKDQEKEKREKKSFELEKKLFDDARKLYPGKKRGLEPEWENFKTKFKPKLKEVVVLLLPAIQAQIKWREEKRSYNGFLPEWKNFKTWINQECWTEEKEQGKENGNRTKSMDEKLREFDEEIEQLSTS